MTSPNPSDANQWPEPLQNVPHVPESPEAAQQQSSEDQRQPFSEAKLTAAENHPVQSQRNAAPDSKETTSNLADEASTSARRANKPLFVMAICGGIVVIVAIVIAAVVAVVAPGSDNKSPSGDTEVGRSVYLDTMGSKFPTLTDDERLTLGNMVCRRFNAGLTWKDQLGLMVHDGADAENAGFVITTAASTLCQEHLDKLP